MRSCCNGLIPVASLILLGCFMVKAKNFPSKSTVDCDNFEERGISYHLPDDVISWERFNELEPCCNEGIEIPGCSVCTDDVLWGFKRRNEELTVCTAVPRGVIEAMEREQEQRRRLVQAGRLRSQNSDPGLSYDAGIKPKERKPVQYSGYGARSNSPRPVSFHDSSNDHGFQQGMSQGIQQEMSLGIQHGINQGIHQGMSPQYKQENPPSYAPQNPAQSYPAALPPLGQQPFDGGYWGNLLSELFSLENPIELSFNISDGDRIKQPVAPVKPVDCVPPVRQDYAGEPNQYPQKEVWNTGNGDYPSVPSVPPSPNVQDVNHPGNIPAGQTPPQSNSNPNANANTNINTNTNTNTMTVRKDQEQPKGKQPQANQKGKSAGKANNRKASKKVQTKRTTVKPGSD